MNSGHNLKFQDIIDRIDYDKLYEALEWEPISTNGDEDKGYCLMTWNHKNGDTTGKLAINRDKGVYNCWVCDGGSILSLVMEVKSLGYQEAMEWLWQFVDAAQKETPDEFYQRVQKLLTREYKDFKPLPYFNDRVLTWEGWDEYFATRNITQDVATYFKLGVDPEHKKFHPQHGEHVGPAAIFPHYWEEKLVGWQERWLEEIPKWIGRYTNTTDFPRETTVWGYDFAIRQEKQPIICESVPTALMLISEGYPAIATFGAQVTSDQLRHLRVFQQGIMLAPDNDLAGTKWLTTATEYLKRFVPVLQVPTVTGSGSDLGDLHPDELSIHLKGITHVI